MTTNTVWNLYADDVRNFVFSKVKDEFTTEDILQETFLKIHTKLHTLKDTSKLKSWVFSIARNSVIDYFKSTQTSFDITGFNIAIENDKDKGHTEEDCLRGIIRNLPKKYRYPLFLADIKGLKQQEVADKLNQTLSTTKSQIQRARKLITKGFMDCCGFELNEKGQLIGELQDKKDCKVCK